ncbi:C-terminal domain phosphatase-like [Musa troglodytarum]|uniref:C-terminal domain phosphatase-like n=1 Tax=Musa troglodytarum TaxID=320322 RepID=A0A9E7JIA6_9LILI|nr:C-terminal domain phosphatase-like [Musa troglodytarum]
MGRRPGISCKVYRGDVFLGEAEVFPAAKNSDGKGQSSPFPNTNEIRVDYLSLPSERCLPLSVLQAISPFALRCKLQARSDADHPLLNRLYLSCFQERKVPPPPIFSFSSFCARIPMNAVVVTGSEELHLVAMPSRVEKVSCFWCCSVPADIYASCLGMLNLRCLAIVFDLDETLMVANTMKSFEDKIED